MLRKVALALLRVYQVCLRGYLPASCRFTPSCSEFTRQAIEQYGFWKGSFKGAKRLLTCHPFSGRSGYDPLN
ncbi:MAG: membrane protein insertion efficiency factor YidD [Candidatus Omnitrophica bacterium]|nr:membrane protein insertion efficiency factor YidD [Candidatus Omnitrophota bacterium]